MTDSHSRNKISEICRTLRKEAIEPAEKEAAHILENATAEAKSIVEKAKERALLLDREAAAKRDQQQQIFEGKMQLAARKCLETLQNNIEEKIFRPAVRQLLQAN